MIINAISGGASDDVLPVNKGGTGVTAAKGSATQPVYLSSSGITACTYTLGKSVPSDAVFTDTKALTSMTGTLGIDHGGTGATSASAARTALGCGSVATLNYTTLSSF